MKKLTAIMPIVTLLLGAAAPSVQAAPSDPSTASVACKLPSSEPWKNHPTHVWNVVWRNQVANCQTKAQSGAMQSAKVKPSLPQASQPQVVSQPQASQPTEPVPAVSSVPENSQPQTP